MRKSRTPVGVLLWREAYELYLSLREEDELKKSVDRGIEALKNDMFAGENIRKRQIPRYYIDKFGVSNLFRLRLDRSRRCVYTIVSDAEGVKVVVLEVFPDHKSYDRRFGYKTH